MYRFHQLALVAMLLAGCTRVSKTSYLPSTERPEVEPVEPRRPETTNQGESRSNPKHSTPKAETPGKPERKNFVVLTQKAAEQIRTLMPEKGATYLRLSVRDGGGYKLDLDAFMNPDEDYLGESREVPIVVDRKSALLLPVGTVVDYLDDAKRFKISGPRDEASPDTSVSLAKARVGFQTKLARRDHGMDPVAVPPKELFRVVHYDAPSGRSAAYLTPDPKDGKKHPAIVWITGGDCNSIDAGCWKEGPPGNDQSASAYRKSGLVMMFPALRGGNDNPGIKEGFLGEVDDVLAAAAFLRQQPFVDPQRVYLGGHSTGGTLVLLTAECSDVFRAVFSFGPVDDVLGYGPQFNPFVLADPKEGRLRSPGRWLHSIKSPVFVFEGTDGTSNGDDLKTMASKSKNPNVHFFPVQGTDHFGVLAPTNRLIADKILRDTGPECNLTFTEEEINKPFVK
jgi:Fe-S cluster assembly iron-binding protein IscA